MNKQLGQEEFDRELSQRVKEEEAGYDAAFEPVGKAADRVVAKADPRQPGRSEAVLPDSARGQIEQATHALKQMQRDAAVIASALEHLRQATGKMIDQLDAARTAVGKAKDRL